MRNMFYKYYKRASKVLYITVLVYKHLQVIQILVVSEHIVKYFLNIFQKVTFCLLKMVLKYSEQNS